MTLYDRLMLAFPVSRYSVKSTPGGYLVSENDKTGAVLVMGCGSFTRIYSAIGDRGPDTMCPPFSSFPASDNPGYPVRCLLERIHAAVDGI